NGEDFLTNTAISTTVPQKPGLRQRVLSDRDLEHVFALYDGEVAWTDAQIGRLLDELAALQLERDTIVILTADHGDEFFEHGGLGPRRTLYEEVLRVPLIVRWPASLPARKRIAGLVSNTDVVPTLLELLDLPAPGAFSGKSFAGLLRGREDGAQRSV